MERVVKTEKIVSHFSILLAEIALPVASTNEKRRLKRRFMSFSGFDFEAGKLRSYEKLSRTASVLSWKKPKEIEEDRFRERKSKTRDQFICFQ